MPKLKVADFDGSSNLADISIAGMAESAASGAQIGRIQRTQAADAAASYAGMGELQKEVGRTQGETGIWAKQQGHKEIIQDRQIASEFQQMNFENKMRQEKALFDAMFNIVNNMATTDFSGQAQSTGGASDAATMAAASNVTPMDQVLDEFAQANAGGRHSNEASAQLNELNQKIVGKYSKALPNEEYKNQFAQSMQQVTNAHMYAANQKQGQTRYQAGRQALDTTIDNEIKLGLIDSPENLGLYSARGLKAITKGLETGIIDSNEGQVLGDRLRKGLYRGAIQVGNTTSPRTVRELLSNSSYKDLNLTPQEYKGLAFQNAAALKDEERDAIAQYKQEQETAKQQQIWNQFQLSEGIKDNAVKSSTIIDEYNKGNLEFDTFIKLLGQSNDAERKRNTILSGRDNLSKDILTGNTLQSYQPSEIDDHYKNLIASRYGKDAKVTLMQKAEIAALYKGPVNDFNKEIQYNIQSGDPENIKNAVQAYEFARARNPMSVADTTKDTKTVAFISSLANKMQYSSDKIENLIQATKDSIYNVDGQTKKAREREFREESAFSANNISKTVANMYGGNPWYRASNEVSERMSNAIGAMLHDAYITEGSVDGAISIVKKQTEGLIGSTDVNKIEKWGVNPSTTMFLPPEKVYEGKYTADEIRGQLNQDVTSLAQHYGISPDSVFIGSDEKSIAMARKGQEPDYFLYYKNKDGHDVPLLDPNTHLLQRWSLSDSNKLAIEGQQIQTKADSALAATTGMLSKYAREDVQLKLPYFGAKLMVLSESEAQKAQNVKLSSPEFISHIVLANSPQDIAAAYTKKPEEQNVLLQTIERSLGPDKSPDRIIGAVTSINSILSSNNKIELLRKSKVTTTPMTGDIAVSPEAHGLYAGMEVKDGKQVVNILQMKNNQTAIVQVPLTTVSFRTLPSNLESAGINERLKYLYSDETILGQINKFKAQKKIRDEIQKQVESSKVREELKKPKFDPYTNQVIDKDGNRVTNSQQVPSGKITGPNKYSTGGTNVILNNNNKDTWWDSVVNKLNSEPNNSGPILPEMQNGKLINPVFDPRTGQYTNDLKQVDTMLQSLKQNLSINSGSVPTKDIQLISDFIESTYSKKPRKFTNDEWTTISKYMGGQYTNGTV